MAEEVVDGDMASRMLLEVSKGITFSSKDTPEEAAFREEMRKSIRRVVDTGGIIEMPKDLDFP